MKKLFIIPLTATCLVLFSFNSSDFFGMIRHDVDIEKYREIGRLPDFNCVGRYSITETDTDYAVGVLIAPQWVLTAAHFVEKPSVWKFGNNFYHTKKVIKHPKLKTLTREAQFDGWDIALVKLDRPVNDIKPTQRYYGNEELKKTITKIGYGNTGNGKVGMIKPIAQEKLGGQNVVDAIGGMFKGIKFSTNVMVCDFDNPENPESNHFGSPTPLALEIGGSKGDSGGGVFIKDGEAYVLIGIVSGALNQKIKYGSVMSLTRVSKANAWINSVIKP